MTPTERRILSTILKRSLAENSHYEVKKALTLIGSPGKLKALCDAVELAQSKAHLKELRDNLTENR